MSIRRRNQLNGFDTKISTRKPLQQLHSLRPPPSAVSHGQSGNDVETPGGNMIFCQQKRSRTPLHQLATPMEAPCLPRLSSFSLHVSLLKCLQEPSGGRWHGAGCFGWPSLGDPVISPACRRSSNRFSCHVYRLRIPRTCKVRTSKLGRYVEIHGNTTYGF